MRLIDRQDQANLLVRLFFRFSLPCLLLLTAAMLLIHGQTDYASEMRTFLMPADCAAPCFLGIRPGQTTLSAGLDQLLASPLIRSISPVPSELGSPMSSDQYDFEFVQPLAPVRAARVKFLVEARTGIIENILLMNTDFQLSDIGLTFGQPAQFVLDDRFHMGFVTYVAFYPQYQMYVQTVLSVCTPSAATFWNGRQSVYIGIASAQNFAQQRLYYPADAQPRGGGWLQQFHDLKKTDCV